MAMRSFFYDCVWVLNAIFRGKIFRQDAYLPKNNMFKVPPGATLQRMKMLVKMYGRRSLKVGELIELKNYRQRNNSEIGRRNTRILRSNRRIHAIPFDNSLRKKKN